jgi:hypothetical protein
MLYATEGIKEDSDFDKAMVGVASVWYVALFFPRPIISSHFDYSAGMKVIPATDIFSVSDKT